MRTAAKVLALLLAAAPATAAHGVVRRMFITSTTGNADLGSWPDAGAATGVAAGDAICQARATAASLPDPTGFRAFLSSSTTDAWCHLHDLTGTKATNCGQPSLPAAAGPWRRVDGSLFGADITHLFFPDQQVLLPPRLDENGAIVHALDWTATHLDGVYSAPSCNDWTSSAVAGTPAAGFSDHTSGEWFNSSLVACSTPLHLLCFEIGVGDALPRFANWGRLAFVTSVAGNGDLGSWPQSGGQTGLAAGDAICQNLATTAGLPYPTAFKAWLSTTAVDARDRFTYDGPWIRLDHARIAANLADLTDGYLNTALNLTETGIFFGSDGLWTGTGPGGLANANRCSDWTSASAAGTGRGSLACAADSFWTSAYDSSCDFAFSHLYCLQDLPLVFGDGFESANAADWTVAVP